MRSVAKKRSSTGFLDRLQDAAKAAGVYTPAQFADRLKVSRQTGYNWWVGGTKSLGADDLFRISDTLGVSARWLVTGDGPMMRKARTFTDQEQMVIALFRALPEPWRSDWVSDGNRELSRLKLPATTESPFRRVK